MASVAYEKHLFRGRLVLRMCVLGRPKKVKFWLGNVETKHSEKSV